MTTLTERLEEYIIVRRSLGYDLSFTARVLRGFTTFANREGADHVTVDLFLRWKESFGKASNNTWSTRLGMVRGFAGWLQGLCLQKKVTHRTIPLDPAHISVRAGRIPTTKGVGQIRTHALQRSASTFRPRRPT